MSKIVVYFRNAKRLFTELDNTVFFTGSHMVVPAPGKVMINTDQVTYIRPWDESMPIRCSSGSWVPDEAHGGWHCSACGTWAEFRDNYCARCGTPMAKPKEEDEPDDDR